MGPTASEALASFVAEGPPDSNIRLRLAAPVVDRAAVEQPGGVKKQWKHYTPEEKVAILRRHLLEQVCSIHKSLKGECIRPGTPLSLEDARRLVEGYVEHYNNVRLNSAIGRRQGSELGAARQQRQIRRQSAA